MTDTRWPRCPSCDAVAHPEYPELVLHRPGCPYTHERPDAWTTN
jgi:hypothetical protein